MTEPTSFVFYSASLVLLDWAQRFLLLSIVGFVVVYALLKWLKPYNTGPVWAVFLGWLFLTSSPLVPGVPQSWMAWTGLSAFILDDPCVMLPVDRVDSLITQSLPFVTNTELLVILWGLISSALLLRIIYKRMSFVGIINKANPVVDPYWLNTVETLRSDYGISRRVYLCHSHSYAAPFTVGYLRPAIFLPSSIVTDLDRETVKVILAHEMAHIARGDDFSVTVQHVFNALFFFNPVVRIAQRNLNDARELDCDCLAVARGKISPRDYGLAMVRVLEYFKGSLTPNVPVAGFLSKDIKCRIHGLMDSRAQQRGWLLSAVLSGAGLLMVSSVLAASKPAPQILPPQHAKALLMQLDPVHPMPGARVTGHLHLGSPLGCLIPERDHYHTGMDLTPQAPGAPVYAIAPGFVSKVLVPAGEYGKLVKIEHKHSIHATYVRLDNVEVKVGQPVGRGQKIGDSGATLVTRHVHFELTRGQDIINPELILAH
ncbi:M23/M56 family metallopeptidase [Gilvimarinus chinensis]|uniref:M23/M56 family metallopeptidase n=1 Tax=Gilvimarinus chinensis TaxID=396005 RepID=UPI00036A9F73|nr:M23/M56 family metallopeptidase [Gilvimarinus chinensis]